MKISKVTPMVLGTEWRNLTIVKVEKDEGPVGVGECRAGQSPKSKTATSPCPLAPGLGVTLDEEVVAANPRRRVHCNLFAGDWHRHSAEVD